MLSNDLLSLTEFDRQLFSLLVPRDHALRRALALIPWDEFAKRLSIYYVPDQGRPALWPVLMLKLEYLRYQFGLSDRQVIKRAETDVAFRYFLQISSREVLPDPTSLAHFRGRLGETGFRELFHCVVAVAREQGLVKDRLRLKDATHVIANIAVPNALGLVAQARDRLLAAAEPFQELRVAGERINIRLLKERTAEQNDQQRLLARVTHLQDILRWVDALPAPEDVASNSRWQRLVKQRELAHKILADREHPEAGDRTLSVVDPDARCGKHGDWYDGYLVDLLVDADSEIVTQVHVLPANGDEAADAAHLVRQEEIGHGNDVQQLSMDGIGFNGRVLRELEDPQGLALDVYVPPQEEAASEVFGPEKFVENPHRTMVTCPAGQVSRYHTRERRENATRYRFDASVCRACALQTQCLKTPAETIGRSVRKNDYEAQYRHAREKARTPQYAAVRAEHAKVERKLGELMNAHGGRRARYRGRGKVQVQELMACTVMNIQRILRLLAAPAACATG
jgi:transposase